MAFSVNHLHMPPPHFAITPNAQQVLQEFSITGHMDLSLHNIWEVLSAAQLFRIQSAIDYCEQFLSMTHSSHLTNLVQWPHATFPTVDSRVTRNEANSTPPSLLQLPETANSSEIHLRHLRNLHCFSTFFRQQISGKVQPDREMKAEKSSTNPTFLNGELRGDETLEVAVCDGPIMFERVLNEFYRKEEGKISPTLSVGTDTSECSTKPKKDKVYACPFCKETFKSMFCYEKHKRRHIHPISDHQKNVAAGGKEKNVCFYPCKYCGLKFPSYYFVHKHRRFCEGIRSNGQGIHV